MGTWPSSELEVAAPVVAYLRAAHWEVYQEVSLGYGARTIDIVATQGPLLWAVEVKRTLSIQLLDQAVDLHGYAHYVSIAVPRSNTKERGVRGRFVWQFLGHYGIGRFRVTSRSDVESLEAPALNRKALVHRLRNCLHDEQKTMAEAGSQGGYWTPFSMTSRNVQRFLADNPGCTFKELVAGIEHHYGSASTARSCLRKWICDGVIAGVRVERDGKAFRLWQSGRGV